MKIDPMEIADLQAELERLHSASFGWALSCCRRDATEAEEVLQTVYLKILEGKARFRGESSLKTWLFAVIRKTAATEYRRRLLRSLRLVAEPEDVSDHVSPYENQSATLERSETQTHFQGALRELPRRQREALHLVFYEDLSLREAADVMGVSIGSARQHYERGKKKLRESLTRMEMGYGNNWGRPETTSAV
ncbi:MAG TPA: RNA polymerase sigma factor [Pyrinomonadaceae bacterium]|nr:RNA polymerase sigma factor [Pyrinomonadaceae bacterium]